MAAVQDLIGGSGLELLEPSFQRTGACGELMCVCSEEAVCVIRHGLEPVAKERIWRGCWNDWSGAGWILGKEMLLRMEMPVVGSSMQVLGLVG